MKFDLLTENEHLWAVRYDDCALKMCWTLFSSNGTMLRGYTISSNKI